MSEHEIQALINAHWNEFMVEEIILAQRDDLEREADEIGQLQLVHHKLQRARLEVLYYSDAISKVVNARNAIGPVASGSQFAHREDLPSESALPSPKLYV